MQNKTTLLFRLERIDKNCLCERVGDQKQKGE